VTGMARTEDDDGTVGYDPSRRPPWLTFVIRLLVASIIATPFVAIILQAIGKRGG
jgi:hypothetical protein